MTPPVSYPDPIKQHRRQFRRGILLPLVLGILLLVAAASVTVLGLRSGSVSLVADWMFACLCLLPLLIVLFPVYLVMVLAAFTLGRADRFTARQVRRVRGSTESLAARTRHAGEALSQRSISFAARFAALDKIFNVFNQPPTSEVKDRVRKQTDHKSQ